MRDRISGSRSLVILGDAFILIEDFGEALGLGSIFEGVEGAGDLSVWAVIRAKVSTRGFENSFSF